MTERGVAVGVDAGGTKTSVAIETADGVRTVEGDAANATTLGVDDAADAIVRAVRRGLDGAHARAICIGAAGAGRAAVAVALRDLVSSAFPHARVEVGDDARIALRAAIAAGPGAVVVAGTGSIAYAEDAGGRGVRVGGLGWLLGDEGSAFAIGLAAAKLYGRVLDGRASADETTALVARALDAPDRDALIGALYDAPLRPAAIASLAPPILAFAGKGNRASTKIVQQAAVELGDLVRAAVRGAGLADASPAIAFAGGLLRENSLLTFLLETRLVGDIAGAAIVRASDPPAVGALRLAATSA